MSSNNNDPPSKKGAPVSTAPLIAEDEDLATRTVGLDQVKAAYLDILYELDWDLGSEYQRTLASHRTQLENADTWAGLRDLTAQVRGTLSSLARLIMDEREGTSQFILEVLRRLSEVEAHLKSSARGTAAVFSESESFSASMAGRIGEMQAKAMAGDSLSEIKKTVLAGLENFKTALQSHRDKQRDHIKTVSAELDHMRLGFRDMQQQLNQMETENRELATRLRVDPLTGAYNRLALEERLKQEIGLLRRGQQVFSVLMVDLDHFKRINDTHGHLIGDKCLVEVVAKLKRGMRVSDMLARYGGEEFAAVLPATPLKDALAAAEKLRQLVAATDFIVRGRKIPVSVSIGVAEAQPIDADPKDVLSRADKGLYRAKSAGRNQVQAV